MFNSPLDSPPFEHGADNGGPKPVDYAEPEEPAARPGPPWPEARHLAHQRLITRIVIAAGHALTGQLQPKGSYREIYDPVTATTYARARRRWIDRLL